jgi:hypothetical protein
MKVLVYGVTKEFVSELGKGKATSAMELLLKGQKFNRKERKHASPARPSVGVGQRVEYLARSMMISS